MSENRLSRLADELTAELEEFLKLKEEITQAQVRVSTHKLDLFELRAVGSILHDIYQNAESIFQHIAKEIDRGVPIGESWHRDLLDKMAQPLPKARPAVVQPDTVKLLDRYRRFRHIFRNLYGFKLDWVQMKPLLETAPLTIAAFAADLEQFIAFLRLMNSEGTSTEV